MSRGLTNFHLLPPHLLRSLEPYLKPKYRFLDFSIIEYMEIMKEQFPNCFSSSIARLPSRPRCVPDSTDLNNPIESEDTIDRVGILEIDYGGDIKTVRCHYSYYKLRVSYVSALDNFLEKIKDGKKEAHFKTPSHFKSSGTFLCYQPEKEVIYCDENLTARGETFQKIIEWLEYLRSRAPTGYVMDRRYN